MLTFVDGLQRGLGIGGLVIGILLAVGCALAVIGLIGLALIYAVGGFDRKKEDP